ncbi:hypothetical protein DRO61_00875 [Candidatus Bathyarchaeota archaeon]|nr:MAG: hypothetical protein DRO61_00875 [Candidatus Bathyarchaeota archaeon]
MATSDETMREKIRVFIQTQLNAARETENNIEFVVIKDIAKTSEDNTEITQIDGTYATVEESMTYAVVYDFFGKPQPIKGMNIISYPIRVDYLVYQKDLDEERFNQEKNAIQKFQRALIGEFFATESFMTNASEYTNTETIIEINGIEYVKYTMIVYITVAEDAYAGNLVKHKIKGGTITEYAEIIVLSPSVIGGTDVYEATILGDVSKTQFGLQKAKSHVIQWGFFWYKESPVIDLLVTMAIAKSMANLDIRIEFPKTIVLENKYYINSFVIKEIPGDIIALSFVFKEPETNYNV